MRNEKEQTGVEWLIQKLTNRQNGVFDGFPYLSVDEIYDKAKEMHKEQMCKFAYKCHNHYKVYGDFNIEQYYEQTYGGDK
jgi:hypothetical protein